MEVPVKTGTEESVDDPLVNTLPNATITAV